jgi:hypothetical protein
MTPLLTVASWYLWHVFDEQVNGWHDDYSYVETLFAAEIALHVSPARTVTLRSQPAGSTRRFAVVSIIEP